MVFFLSTLLVSAVVILIVSWVLEWIFGAIAAEPMRRIGRIATTAAIVSLATAAYVYVMTRPAIVGPYEQWTFENIGGQVIAGVVVAGSKIWMGRKTES